MKEKKNFPGKNMEEFEFHITRLNTLRKFFTTEKSWGSPWIGRDLIEEESEASGLENLYHSPPFTVLMSEILNRCVTDRDTSPGYSDHRIPKYRDFAILFLPQKREKIGNDWKDTRFDTRPLNIKYAIFFSLLRLLWHICWSNVTECPLPVTCGLCIRFHFSQIDQWPSFRLGNKGSLI